MYCAKPASGWRHWLVVAMVVAHLGLALAGLLTTTFVPAPWLVSPWLLLALVVVGMLFASRLFRPIPSGESFRVVGMVALLGAVFAVVAWLAYAKAVAGLATALIGAPHAESVPVRTQSGYKRLRCYHRAIGARFDATFPGHVCIDKALYDAHPDAQVTVRLTGLRSVLGFRIEHIEAADTPP